MEQKSEIAHKTIKKIRIAFIIWTLKGMGGSEHVVLDIVRKINKNRFSIMIISFEDGPVRHAYENLNVKVSVIEKKRKLDFRFIQELRYVLRKESIDIINPHHFSPLIFSFLATRMTGIKIIYTEHSVWQYLELSLLKKLLSNFLLMSVDAILAISNQLINYYNNNRFVSKKKLHLIPNGIDLLKFKPADCSDLKNELGFVADDILIGMVANLRPEKNHKILVSAFSKLSDKISNTHLVLVGLDCMNGEIQRYAETFGQASRIHFLGSRKDVPNLINIFDVFCLPSRHEGLPLVILEAMACGVAVVGSNVLGINEVITDCENGLLFDSGDEKMLSDKLERIITNESLRVKLKQAGLDYVKDNYCLDEKIKDYECLFQKISQKFF